MGAPMEPMKQCPNCGKYVTADKTYCMSCGTTLGVKCPTCGKVVPLQTKVCPCGHSFVKRVRRKTPSRVMPFVKKHALWLLLSLLALVLVAGVVLSCMPAVGYHLIYETQGSTAQTPMEANALEVMGYFLGGHPASIQEILSQSHFKAITTPLTLLLYGEGLGWLLMLVSLVLSVLLGFVNCQKLGRVTSKTLLKLHGVVLGGGLVIFGTDLALCGLMKNALGEALGANLSVSYEVGSVCPLLAFIFCAVLFGGHLFLHLVALKGREGVGELGLSSILKTPFLALAKLGRRVFRKKTAEGDMESQRSITCTKKFTVYLILLGVSLVFTQALLSKISHIFFWFMFLLPLPMLLYALIAKHALTVTMISESATTQKNTPYVYEFDIENHSILAFPFIEAYLSIPQANSVRCTQRCVHLAMAPLSTYHMKNKVCFRFRGTYDIGVQYIYVYDFFKMFRVRVPVSYVTSVYVLPRKLTMDDLLAQAVSDSTLRTVSSPLVFDRLEVSDIRDYRMGDSLKSIHWKLSSKSEELIVKEHNTGTSDQTVIFCDMAAHYPDEALVAPVVVEIPPTAKEKREARRARQAAEAEAKKATPAKRRKGRNAQTEDTHELSDEALAERLEQRRQVAERSDHQGGVHAEEVVATPAITPEVVDVHKLSQPEYYDDMNEYLADGVVELTIAHVLAELGQGHEVTLVWYDRRSPSGIFAYALKGVEAFDQIYNLFATAPVAPANLQVTNLTAVVSEIQNAKQLFVVSAMDSEMLSRMLALQSIADANAFGSAEVMLYNPEERFAHPMERFSYLDGCRSQLSGVGVTLRVSGMIAVHQEDADASEATTNTQKKEVEA